MSGASPTPKILTVLPQGVRKLVPIAHFDMVGYSRLIGAGEEAALARIRSLRATLFDPVIARYGGNVVQTAGDSLLVLFDSILNAVRCAAVIQQRIPDHQANAGADADSTIRFRIGVEIGDVIADRGDLHGEGLIVAVRLESLCPPGAICVSRAVFDAVAGRLPVTVTPLGAVELKNIARPIEAFALSVDAEAEIEPATTVGQPASPFDELAAIAVLPFHSSDRDDVVTDGLTEDLINALAAWRYFAVISRHSTFVFRDRDVDVRTIGRELGARYIVSGSVRRRATTVRISVHLDDCDTAATLLSETFEREAGDTFAAQDEVVRAIAAVMGPEIQKLERERAIRRLTPNRSAHELFTRGMWHRYRNEREDLAQAEALFRAALEIEPDYAPARAALALCRNFAVTNGWTDDADGARAESLALARQAVADDPRDPHAHFALGCACMVIGRLDEAMMELRTAIRLNPSHAYARANLGHVLNYMNRPDEAFGEVQLALRLNPHDPRRFMWLPYLAASHYLARRYRECLAASEQALVANPSFPLAARYMLASLGQLGRLEEAQRVIPLVRRSDPTLQDLELRARRLFVPEAVDHLMEGFRRAGFT
ncbi:MAG: hypothetical protein JO326_04445 [Acetobacteraceae bacterium]|nr:hypothetical protein [Acetobacteraceae bacterium]